MMSSSWNNNSHQQFTGFKRAHVTIARYIPSRIVHIWGIQHCYTLCTLHSEIEHIVARCRHWDNIQRKKAEDSHRTQEGAIHPFTWVTYLAIGSVLGTTVANFNVQVLWNECFWECFKNCFTALLWRSFGHFRNSARPWLTSALLQTQVGHVLGFHIHTFSHMSHRHARQMNLNFVLNKSNNFLLDILLGNVSCFHQLEIIKLPKKVN